MLINANQWKCIEIYGAGNSHFEWGNPDPKGKFYMISLIYGC